MLFSMLKYLYLILGYNSYCYSLYLPYKNTHDSSEASFPHIIELIV